MCEMRIFKKIAVVTVLLLVFQLVLAGCSSGSNKSSESNEMDYLISNNISINSIHENSDERDNGNETDVTGPAVKNPSDSNQESEDNTDEGLSDDHEKTEDGSNSESENNKNEIAPSYPENQENTSTEEAPADGEPAVVPQTYVQSNDNQTDDDDYSYEDNNENGQNGKESGTDSDDDEIVTKHDNAKDNENDSDTDSYSEGTYFEISGLKDKSVQQKINNRIFKVYSDMKNDIEIPSYRGIMQEIEDDMILVNTNVNVLIYGNFNNILSLKCVGNYTFGNPTKSDKYGYIEDSVVYTKIETLNFDLNTGNEISLKDLFADSVDYKEYVNKYIDNMALKSDDGENTYIGDNLSFTAPFKGITDEQKFTVSTDGVRLLFDYSTPEIYLYGYYPNEIKLDQGDNGVVETRFSDGSAKIYEDETVSYMLKENNYDINKMEETSRKINVAEEPYELILECTAKYYNDMPDGVKEFIGANLFPDDEKKAEINDRYQEILKNRSGRNITGNGVHSIDFGNCYGGYVSLYITGYFDFYDNENYIDDASIYDNKVYCFAPDSTEPLKIKDLFKKDVDYNKVLYNAFCTQYENNMKNIYPEGDYCSNEELKQIWREASDIITGFEVCEEYINFKYDYEALDDILMDEYPNDETMRNVISYSLYDFYYRNIGCENLTIFN